VTELAETALMVKPTKEKISHHLPRPSKENIRLPLISGDRDELGKLITLSVHANSRVALRVVQNSERKLRPKNSMSVSLPPLRS
jgi:hypothetical protein